MINLGGGVGLIRSSNRSDEGIHKHLVRTGLYMYWCTYVFRQKVYYETVKEILPEHVEQSI